MQNIICVSACATMQDKGGLYTYAVADDGKLRRLDYLAVDRPMYTALCGETLSVLTMQYTGVDSGLATVDLDRTGRFGAISDYCSTHGVEACHLCVDEKDAYAVNYTSGSVVRMPDTVRTFYGSGPNANRQDSAHTHCVIFSPCKKYVLVTDLGTDAIHVLDRALQPVTTVKVPAGHGARHILFSGDAKHLYCVNELAATVSVFDWNAVDGCLDYVHTFGSEVSAEAKPTNTAAAIRLSRDGKTLYISNRGEDTLVVFKTEDGVHFDLVQKTACGGRHPRDFLLTADETYLVCANTFSDSVTVFALENSLISSITDTVQLPRPLCIMNV